MIWAIASAIFILTLAWFMRKAARNSPFSSCMGCTPDASHLPLLLNDERKADLNKAEMMTMVIKFWSDFACPYCYIGEKRLHDAIDNLGLSGQIELVPMAFELDPNAPKTVQTETVSRFAQKYRMPIEEARAQVEHISKLGHECGLDFRYADAKYTNTFDAHRLMKLAEATDRNVLAKLNFLLFDAYFAKSEQLADHAVLIRLGKEAGLAEDAIREVLDSDKFAQEVRADEAAAARAGVHGVPYFVFEDGVTIPGAASRRDLEDIIRRNLKGAKISGEGAGETCGINGCKIRN